MAVAACVVCTMMATTMMRQTSIGMNASPRIMADQGLHSGPGPMCDSCADIHVAAKTHVRTEEPVAVIHGAPIPSQSLNPLKNGLIVNPMPPKSGLFYNPLREGIAHSAGKPKKKKKG